jgi:hypothetical protein
VTVIVVPLCTEVIIVAPVCIEVAVDCVPEPHCLFPCRKYMNFICWSFAIFHCYMLSGLRFFFSCGSYLTVSTHSYVLDAELFVLPQQLPHRTHGVTMGTMRSASFFCIGTCFSLSVAHSLICAKGSSSSSPLCMAFTHTNTHTHTHIYIYMYISETNHVHIMLFPMLSLQCLYTSTFQSMFAVPSSVFFSPCRSLISSLCVAEVFSE